MRAKNPYTTRAGSGVWATTPVAAIRGQRSCLMGVNGVDVPNCFAESHRYDLEANRKARNGHSLSSQRPDHAHERVDRIPAE